MTMAIIPPAGTISPVRNILGSRPTGKDLVKKERTPIVDDEVARSDFKGHQSGLEDEEVPTSCEAKGFIDVSACKTYEWAGYWQICDL